MSESSVRPEDILPDNQDIAVLGGVPVRKGSIAAFLANVEELEKTTLNSEQRQEVIHRLKELAPALVAAGLYKHAVFKNSQVQSILNACVQQKL